MSCPSRVMVPASAMNSPAMALNSVDLPAPLEPTMVAKSPASRWRSTACRATFSLTVPGLKVLLTWFRSSTGRTFFLCAGTAAAESRPGLQGGGRDGQRHDDGGDQLEALRRDVGPQGQRDDETVDHAARHGR